MQVRPRAYTQALFVRIPDRFGLCGSGLDNFYFNDDGSVGLLDWQIIATGPVTSDISWVLAFHDLYSRFTTEEVDMLLSGYWDELQTLSGGSGCTYEAFMELLALTHVATICKAVLGTGGLSNTDVHAKQIMHLLVSRIFDFRGRLSCTRQCLTPSTLCALLDAWWATIRMLEC